MTQSEKNIGNRVVYSDPENLAAEGLMAYMERDR
jgi:hypothetical protein